MDDKELELRRQYEALSSAKLREIRACRAPSSGEHAILSQILEDRDFWRRFWTSGIVAWLSLAVAVTALIVSLWRKT